MTDEIRRALDARLAALEASPERRARIRARIEATERKEEPVMRRKFSMAVALVTALVLLGGTALAAGLGLNLFEYFGRVEKDWADIAERAVLETEAPVTIEHETLGAVEAVVTNAYYDGEKLLVAYMVQDGDQMDYWAPTDKQTAGLDPVEQPAMLKSDFYSSEQRQMAEAIREAEAAGQAIGFVTRTIRGDSALVNGAELMPYMSEEEVMEDGAFCQIIDYETPLPEGVRDQASLELRIPLWQAVAFYWFDGSQWYGKEEIVLEAVEMTAVVQRTVGESPEWTAK